MSTAVVAINQDKFTPDQMKLITDVVARGATKDELALFLHRCKAMDLDPLKPGQIYFIKYGSGPGTIVVGIEGFRAKAAKTGRLSGISRGVLRDDKGACIGAWAEVHRTDWTHPTREEVSLVEYNTGKAQWAKMPETMIKKVAEAAALRMAFPDDLGGVYAEEEMDQAEGSGAPLILPEQPSAEMLENSLVSAWKYEVSSWKGKKLDEVFRIYGLEEMRAWVVRAEAYVAKGIDRRTGKPLTPEKLAQWNEAIDMTCEFIAEWENSPIDKEPGSDG